MQVAGGGRSEIKFDALALQRVGHALYLARVPFVPKLLKAAGLTLFGCMMSPETHVGADTQLGNRGLGIAIHPRVRIGRRVMIGSSVTIGGRAGEQAVPVIEDDVLIGVGARILGPVTVGRGATVGANAVVIRNVAAGSVVGGVPARELSRSDSQGPSLQHAGGTGDETNVAKS